MKSKLVILGSWAGVLMSATSEYGFGEDFPLTPALWLTIAFAVMCAVFLSGRITPCVRSDPSFSSAGFSAPYAPALKLAGKPVRFDGARMAWNTGGPDIAKTSRTLDKPFTDAGNFASVQATFGVATERGPPFLSDDLPAVSRLPCRAAFQDSTTRPAICCEVSQQCQPKGDWK